MKRTAFRRYAYMMLSAALVLSMILSCAFIATHVNHDCAGEDCRICLQLVQSRRLLKSFGILLLIAAVSTAYESAFSNPASFRKTNQILPTPVLLKVKLTD